MLAAEAAARRRGPTQEVEEVLSELVERLEMEPKLAEGTVVLEVARDALRQLWRHYSYSGAPAELRESVSAALDALTILIAMTDEERTARPPLQVDQVATEVRSRIEARARLISGHGSGDPPRRMKTAAR